MQGAQCGPRSLHPGSCPEPKAGTQLLSHTGVPGLKFFNCVKIHITKVYQFDQFFNVQFRRVFSALVLSCTRSPELFPPCQSEALYPLNNNFPFLPPPQPLAPTLLLCLYELVTPGTSCEWWNHTGSELLCLADVNVHDVLKVYPPCSRCQCFLPFEE